MNKIIKAFENKKGFVGFLTAGDPSLEKTEEFIVELEKAGATVIEIGIPFSDPVAEGTVVQNANVRALSAPNGCTTDMIFDMVEKVRDKVTVPFVFITYLNPVYKYGYEDFCKKCSEVGVSGILIPDMPYEEKGELAPIAEKYGVDIISLIAPTSKNRIEMIAKDAKGYIYVTSPMEDNGIKSEDIMDVEEIVAEIRKVTDNPVVIECDIQTPAEMGKYSKVANGIVVRNAAVKIIEKYAGDAGKYIYDSIKEFSDALK